MLSHARQPFVRKTVVATVRLVPYSPIDRAGVLNGGYLASKYHFGSLGPPIHSGLPSATTFEVATARRNGASPIRIL